MPCAVLVLGAGLAGLSAAIELSEAGYNVAILEARSRVGGRVHTLRDSFEDGLYAEVGAARIPSTHTLTLKYASRFGMTLEPFYPSFGSTAFLWRGCRSKVPFGASPDLRYVRGSFTRQERESGYDNLERLYLDCVTEEVRALPTGQWPFVHTQIFKNISVRDFLRSRGASSDAIACIAQGFEDSALLDFIHDAISLGAPKLWTIRGGNDLLPLAMANKLAGTIRLGAEVRQIEQTSSRVKVTYVTNGIAHVESADRLVCTIPFPALERLITIPSWSKDKAAVISNLSLCAATRVFLQTRRRFWEDDGLNGFATTGQPLELWNATHSQAGKRGILVFNVYQDLARRYSGFTRRELFKTVTNLVERVYPNARGSIEAVSIRSWHTTRYTYGGYQVCKPFQFAYLNRAAVPEGRIHFAGEHCSPWPGWMQGAIEAGLRAAKEIDEAG